MFLILVYLCNLEFKIMFLILILVVSYEQLCFVHFDVILSVWLYILQIHVAGFNPHC